MPHASRLPGLPGFLSMPDGATRDSRLLIMARGIRAFGDGCVSILLPVWLSSLGFSGIQIGAITTATLLRSLKPAAGRTTPR